MFGRLTHWAKSLVRTQYRTRPQSLSGRLIGQAVLWVRRVRRPAAEGEIHVLVAHAHTYMCITALKSFLRFHADVAVVVHDDGTLSTDDRTAFEVHVPGVRVIRRTAADAIMRRTLGRHRALRRYRHSVVNALELLDHL